MSRLGELLVREKMISLQQLQEAQTEAKRTGRRLGVALSRLGYVNDQDLTQFLARQYSLPSINLNDFEIDGDVLKLVPKEVAMKHMVVPVNRAGGTLIVAMSDPSNIFAIDELKFLTQYNIEPVVAAEAAIEEAIRRYYDKGPDLGSMLDEFGEVEFEGVNEKDLNVVDLENQAGEAPVVKLCNAILLSAVKKMASDIHVEPYEKFFRVRFRVDGILHEEMRPPLRMRNAITSRLKIMASLDIAERRLPQDGRIKLKIGKDKEMDFRVSCLPTLYGEKIVLRLLDKSQLQLDMTKLGFEARPLDDFKEAIRKPYGMVLVTGPTGSGKTTTLYAALSEIRSVEDKIITIEDPVEYQLPGVLQIPVNEKKGLTFAVGLRSILRHDPDKIMVGEIRDSDTANIAVQSALTGHQVFTTVHANNVFDVIGRFMHMQVDLYSFISALNGILAQRLLRLNCPHCAEPYVPDDAMLADSGLTRSAVAGFQFRIGRGCGQCRGTGYRGRKAIAETLTLTDELRELITAREPIRRIKEAARRNGTRFLRETAVDAVRSGETTLQEINRVTFVA